MQERLCLWRKGTPGPPMPSVRSSHLYCFYSHMTITPGHVIEEARPAEMGVELLTKTREDWLDSLIGSHINWHLALNYLRKIQL